MDKKPFLTSDTDIQTAKQLEKEPCLNKGTGDVKETVTRRKLILAFILVFGSLALQGLGAVGVQILHGAVPNMELNLLRNGLILFVLIPIVLRQKIDVRFPWRKVPFVILAAMATNIQNICYYAAAKDVALGTLSAMVASIAIALNTSTSICIKAERSVYLYGGAVVSIIGLFLMAQPAFLFHHTDTNEVHLNWTPPCVQAIHHNMSDAAYDPVVTGNITAGKLGTIGDITAEKPRIIGVIPPKDAIFIVLTSGFIVIQVLSNKRTVCDGTTALSVTLWTAVIGTLLSIILMPFIEKPVLLTSPYCITLLLLHCISVEQSMIIIPWAAPYVLPPIITMSFAMPIIVQMICQYTFLKNIQPGFGNWEEIFGGILCSLGILLGPLLSILCKKM